jgi:hypothetical protein
MTVAVTEIVTRITTGTGIVKRLSNGEVRIFSIGYEVIWGVEVWLLSLNHKTVAGDLLIVHPPPALFISKHKHVPVDCTLQVVWNFWRMIATH